MYMYMNVDTKATNRKNIKYSQSQKESQSTISAAVEKQTTPLQSYDKRAKCSQMQMVAC